MRNDRNVSQEIGQREVSKKPASNEQKRAITAIALGSIPEMTREEARIALLKRDSLRDQIGSCFDILGEPNGAFHSHNGNGHTRVGTISTKLNQELWSLVVSAVPKALSFEKADAIIARAEPISSHIRSCFPRAKRRGCRVSSWELFYRELFYIDVDLSDLDVGRREHSKRLLVWPSELSYFRIDEAMKRVLGHEGYDCCIDLTSVVDLHTDEQPYRIFWVRGRRQADKELACLSAEGKKSLQERGVKTLCLKGQMIHHLKHYLGRDHVHLDTHHATLCAGSRIKRKGLPDMVPSTRFTAWRFRVSAKALEHRAYNLCARQIF